MTVCEGRDDLGACRRRHQARLLVIGGEPAASLDGLTMIRVRRDPRHTHKHVEGNARHSGYCPKITGEVELFFLINHLSFRRKKFPGRR